MENKFADIGNRQIAIACKSFCPPADGSLILHPINAMRLYHSQLRDFSILFGMPKFGIFHAIAPVQHHIASFHQGYHAHTCGYVVLRHRRTSACVRVCVFVCKRRWANEEVVSASLRECVVSEDPISPPPRAWLQGLRRTASTDEFVSVIKPRSVACTGTRQTWTRGCSWAHASYTKNRPFMSTAAHRFTALISAAQCIVTVTELAVLKQLNVCAHTRALTHLWYLSFIWHHHVGW